MENTSCRTTKRLLRSYFLLLITVSIFLFCFNQSNSLVSAQSEGEFEFEILNLPYKTHEVYVTLWLKNMFSFDYKTGNYIFDMLIVFSWSNPDVTELDWEIINGAPIVPGSTKIVKEYSQVVSEKEIKVEIYRSTFNLFSPLGAEQFPFDRIELPIIIEVIPQAELQSIVWVESLSGISSNYENLGWNSPEFELTSDHASPFGLTVPRASFVVIQNRKAEVGLITAIAPPLLFCAISASAFLLHLNDQGGLSMRLSLSASVLVTAILFHISTVSNIPPITGLSLWTIYMISVLSFLSINLIVTVLGYVEFRGQQRESRFKQISRRGIIISLAIPILLFVLLFFFR